MVATLTSSSSLSRSSTFDNLSDTGQSTSPTSTPSLASHQSHGSPSPSSANNLSTCDSTSTGGHTRDNSSQLAMKRFIFGDYNIDWRSIPTVDEDTPFNHATLLYRSDLRCKASREYYMEILNGFRIKPVNRSTALLSDTGTIIIDGEEIVDMIA